MKKNKKPIKLYRYGNNCLDSHVADGDFCEVFDSEWTKGLFYCKHSVSNWYGWKTKKEAIMEQKKFLLDRIKDAQAALKKLK